MKTKLFILGLLAVVLCSCGGGSSKQQSQGILVKTRHDSNALFTVVYSNSSDGFTNIRQTASGNGQVLGRLEEMNHGLGCGYMIDATGDWCLVKSGQIEGYCLKRYVGTQLFFSGMGATRLVAISNPTPVFTEDYSGGRPVGAIFARLTPGMVIADAFVESGDYYVLSTGHDCLLVNKSDVRVESNADGHSFVRPVQQTVTRSSGLTDYSSFLLVVASCPTKEGAIRKSRNYDYDLLRNIPVWECEVKGEITYRLAMGFDSREEAKIVLAEIKDMGFSAWICERQSTDVLVWME